jgi:hypothetical protein
LAFPAFFILDALYYTAMECAVHRYFQQSRGVVAKVVEQPTGRKCEREPCHCGSREATVEMVQFAPFEKKREPGQDEEGERGTWSPGVMIGLAGKRKPQPQQQGEPVNGWVGAWREGWPYESQQIGD